MTHLGFETRRVEFLLLFLEDYYRYIVPYMTLPLYLVGKMGEIRDENWKWKLQICYTIKMELAPRTQAQLASKLEVFINDQLLTNEHK